MRLRLQVRPRASRTAVAGPFAGALRIRLAAPPVDGEANAELVAFLAKRLGVPKAAVAIVRGAAGRRKVVEVEGVSAADAAAALGL